MIYVIFPAFNEEKVIRPTLLALAETMRGFESTYRAILVDDGSTDATLAEAQRAVAESDGRLPLTVLRHEVNLGLGAGLRTGIYWCLDQATDEDLIVTLDADNKHPPSLIPTLVERVGQGFDVAIASRYRQGSEVHGVPGYRRALSDVGRLVFQSLYPIPGVRDYTCCFRAYRVPILRKARRVYGDDLCTARGFEAVMDLLLRLGPLDMKATEIGFKLDYGGRVGQSKMKVLQTIRKTVALLARRRVERIFRYSRRQIRERLVATERAPAGARPGPSASFTAAAPGASLPPPAPVRHSEAPTPAGASRGADPGDPSR